MRVTDPPSPASAQDVAVTREPSASRSADKGENDTALSVRREPAAIVSLRQPARDLVDPTPSDRPDAPAIDADSEARRDTAWAMIGLDVDVRAMTPREAANVGLQLYAEGMVSWEEYAELAFQPELHPSYDSTIGALLGETASPDAPRDFVLQWEERVAYEQRYNAIDSQRVRSTQKIARVLERLAGDGVRLDA